MGSRLDDGDGGPALAALRRRLVALGDALTRQAYLGLRRSELQVARYPGDGARYARHRDAFRDAAAGQRRVSAIVYLNPAWTPADGGCLRLHVPGGPLGRHRLVLRALISSRSRPSRR